MRGTGTELDFEQPHDKLILATGSIPVRPEIKAYGPGKMSSLLSCSRMHRM